MSLKKNLKALKSALMGVPRPSVTIYETTHNRFMVVTRADKVYAEEEVEGTFDEACRFGREKLDEAVADPYLEGYQPFMSSLEALPTSDVVGLNA